MSGSTCYFLTCIQIPQEAGKMVWYSHLFKNFSLFVVIHTVKGFGIINKPEVNVSLDLSCFYHDPMDVGNLTLPFLIWFEDLEGHHSHTVEVWLREVWALLCWCVLWVQLCSSLNFLWHPLSWDWDENWPFPFRWPLLSFPNFLAYWVQHFHSIIFYDLK